LGRQPEVLERVEGAGTATHLAHLPLLLHSGLPDRTDGSVDPRNPTPLRKQGAHPPRRLPITPNPAPALAARPAPPSNPRAAARRSRRAASAGRADRGLSVSLSSAPISWPPEKRTEGVEVDCSAGERFLAVAVAFPLARCRLAVVNLQDCFFRPVLLLLLLLIVRACVRYCGPHPHGVGSCLPAVRSASPRRQPPPAYYPPPLIVFSL
jgi:hypothetical protein